jgi:hypothetical protein
MADAVALAEEQARADRLRRTVDVACAVLRQGGFSPAEAEAVVADTRRLVLELFPGKEDVFDLVLAPRFARIVEECTRGGTRGTPRERRPEGPGTRGTPSERRPEGPDQSSRGKLLPFPRRF